MCLICTEYQKGKLTVNEAWNNLREMQDTLDPEHVDVILTMLFFGDAYEDVSVIDYGQMIEEEDWVLIQQNGTSFSLGKLIKQKWIDS